MRKERKYYSKSDIVNRCDIKPSLLDYWMTKGLENIVGPVKLSTKRKQKMYNSRQLSMIEKMASLMASGNYTVKGALTILKYQYA